MEVQEGYARIYVAGDIVRIEDWLESNDEKNEENAGNIYLVIDRLTFTDNKETISRLTDSCETAFFEGDGMLQLLLLPSKVTYDFSTRFEADGIKFEEPNDNMFFFQLSIRSLPYLRRFWTHYWD